MNEILIRHQFVMLLPNMWPGDARNPLEESDISRHRAAVCTRAGREGMNRGFVWKSSLMLSLSLTSKTRVLTALVFQFQGIAHSGENIRTERCRQRAGTPGEGGAQTEREVGIVFVNPPTSGFY